MRAAIVGIQGVGICHAIACDKLGIEVVAVCDTDPAAAERVAAPWHNTWAGDKVHYNPKSRPWFTTNLKVFLETQADLLVIATPTQYHIPILNKLGPYYGKILVEKPLSYSAKELNTVSEEVKVKTFVSHEWLTHPLRPKTLINPAYIYQGHPYPPIEAHKKECGVLWDLGVHCAAELYTRVPPQLWPTVSPEWWHINKQRATAGINITGGHQMLATVIEVAYQPGPNMLLNFQELSWDDAMFEAQIAAVVRGTHLASFHLAATACTLIEGIVYHAKSPSDTGA